MSSDADQPHSSQATPEDTSAAPEDRKPSRLRLWLFRIIAATVVPLLFLGFVEVVLRIVGYGYPTSYFVEMRGKGVYAANSHFGRRFFPRALTREPWPVYVAKCKPAGAYRIFVLGGSAAQGVPDPAFSFGRILETMLTDVYPNATFEVIPTGMTAVNSHVILPIARDCAEHEPDLLIVYLGNNEVVGPFGAGTVLQGFSPSMTVIRAYLAAQTTRVGQLVVDIAERLKSKKGLESWQGMEMFLSNRVPADDPRLAVVYNHFRRNLQDTCRAARDADAETILCTVGVNLQDCSPFASQHKPDLNEAELARWDEAFQGGVESAPSGDASRAIEQFLVALAIDDQFAELHFRLGKCYLDAGQDDLAVQAFTKARDLDVLRFRADSTINRVIRDVAEARAEEGVHLVDSERALAECGRSAAGVPGGTLFYEHVHMTFEGNYEVAKAIFSEVVKLLPETIRSESPSPSPPSLNRCAARMKLTALQRVHMLKTMLDMTARPPFTGQYDSAQRREAMMKLCDELTSQVNSASGAPTR